MFAGIPHKDYLSAPGTSNSTLKHIRPTPAHLQHYLTHKDEEVASWDQIAGTLVHSAILLPDEPLPQIAIQPKTKGFANSNEGKAWIAEQESAGRIVMGEDKFKTVQRCIIGAQKCQLLCDIVKDSDCEVSLWDERQVELNEAAPVVPLLLKCRFDILPRDAKLILDVKTTDDASEDEWQRAVERHGYHRQAAWYIDLLGEQRAWFFALIEKPTGFVRITQLHPAAIDAGRKENERDLQKLAWCVANNEWPGYSIDGSDVSNLPTRYYYKPQV